MRTYQERLLTDIHEHVEYLREAADRFHAEPIDQIVAIGDVLEMGERIEVTSIAINSDTRPS